MNLTGSKRQNVRLCSQENPLTIPLQNRSIENSPLGFYGGDTNLYRFVGDDPTNAVDPSGLEGIRPIRGRFQPPADQQINGGRGTIITYPYSTIEQYSGDIVFDKTTRPGMTIEYRGVNSDKVDFLQLVMVWVHLSKDNGFSDYIEGSVTTSNGGVIPFTTTREKKKWVVDVVKSKSPYWIECNSNYAERGKTHALEHDPATLALALVNKYRKERSVTNVHAEVHFVTFLTIDRKPFAIVEWTNDSRWKLGGPDPKNEFGRGWISESPFLNLNYGTVKDAIENTKNPKGNKIFPKGNWIIE